MSNRKANNKHTQSTKDKEAFPDSSDSDPNFPPGDDIGLGAAVDGESAEDNEAADAEAKVKADNEAADAEAKAKADKKAADAEAKVKADKEAADAEAKVKADKEAADAEAKAKADKKAADAKAKAEADKEAADAEAKAKADKKAADPKAKAEVDKEAADEEERTPSCETCTQLKPITKLRKYEDLDPETSEICNFKEQLFECQVCGRRHWKRKKIETEKSEA